MIRGKMKIIAPLKYPKDSMVTRKINEIIEVTNEHTEFIKYDQRNRKECWEKFKKMLAENGSV